MRTRPTAVLLFASLLFAPSARADVITDWNTAATDVMVEAQLLPTAMARGMAMIQAAVYEAVNTIAQDRTSRTKGAARAAALDAAVAAANRATLSSLIPAQQPAIDRLYQAALGRIADGPAKDHGIGIGEKAAAAILALRANEGGDAPDEYRPRTAPGAYVPTLTPFATQWARRKPWILSSPDQFRPAPPPALTSEVWARDYNEIKAIGSKNSTRRTEEQTTIARFWETRGAQIYLPIVRSLALAPGRKVEQNARLFAAATQAMDDALIAVFDAKYHYGFWRPITAIRNGDQDGNDATERDASWAPLIETPMHPEYPCAHCIGAAAVGAVLQAEVGKGPMPTLRTTSPTAPGVVRSWTRIEDLVQEVSNARIYDGVHFRNSTEVGAAMGKKIGTLAAQKLRGAAGRADASPR